MDTRRAAAALKDLFEAARPGALEVIDQLAPYYAEDMRFEDPLQRVEGREAFLETNRKLVSRAKVLEFRFDTMVVEGSDAFYTWEMRVGIGIAPVGAAEGATHLRFRDGLVVHHRDYWDSAAFFATTVPGGRTVLRKFFGALG
jgi:hypothetical protein